VTLAEVSGLLAEGAGESSFQVEVALTTDQHDAASATVTLEIKAVAAGADRTAALRRIRDLLRKTIARDVEPLLQ